MRLCFILAAFSRASFASGSSVFSSLTRYSWYFLAASIEGRENIGFTTDQMQGGEEEELYTYIQHLLGL